MAFQSLGLPPRTGTSRRPCPRLAFLRGRRPLIAARSGEEQEVPSPVSRRKAADAAQLTPGTPGPPPQSREWKPNGFSQEGGRGPSSPPSCAGRCCSWRRGHFQFKANRRKARARARFRARLLSALRAGPWNASDQTRLGIPNLMRHCSLGRQSFAGGAESRRSVRDVRAEESSGAALSPVSSRFCTRGGPCNNLGHWELEPNRFQGVFLVNRLPNRDGCDGRV